MSDGMRKIVNISEITGLDENIINMHEIFTFHKKGISPDGKVVGSFQPSRIRPRFRTSCRFPAFICGTIYLSTPWR
jgi:pilus assembly protein CpaF